MDELVEFLRARLDEDEKVANNAIAATFGEEPVWTAKDDGTGEGAYGYVMADHAAICGHDCDDVRLAHAEHIARHDPARTLREIEAKRLLLDIHSPMYPASDRDDPFPTPAICSVCHDYRMHDAERLPCETLQVLAGVYRDHPDYRPEWETA